MIHGAIFDIDGVLLDSMGFWHDLGSRLLKKNNIAPKPETDNILYSMSMEQGAEYLEKNYFSYKCKEKILDEIKDMLKDFYFYEAAPKNGAEDMLKFFKSQNTDVVCATSSPREHVTRALERVGLAKYISKIYTTSEIGESKHSPKIYLEAASFLNTKPVETLVFEDSLYALKTAAEAKFYTIGVFDKYGNDDIKKIKACCSEFVEDLKRVKKVSDFISSLKA